MKLPLEFMDRMEQLLKDEYQYFIESYHEPRNYGLRANTLKISVEDLKRILPFDVDRVPWTNDGFYYKEGERPGKHPFYHAGLYYIQEPSAMVPGAIADIVPGQRVLDLCAAPGGKSLQAAAALKGQGVLVTNDINPSRLKALLRNIEQYGVRNAIVTNESPEKLSRTFSNYFDKILVDAPCSGEGTFRKDEDSIKAWNKDIVKEFQQRQKEILDFAAMMLKPGGEIIYSTCTFAPEENEGVINEFLLKYKDFTVIPLKQCAGLQGGRPDWIEGNKQLEGALRIWPHKAKGEGHFVVKLKNLLQDENKTSFILQSSENTPPQEFSDFIQQNLNIDIKGNFVLFGQHLYLIPNNIPSLNGLKVLNPGWHLGIVKKNRFEPSQSLALSLNKEQFKRYIDFPIEDRNVIEYLKGHTLRADAQKGWTAIGTNGYTLGWGKVSDGIIKNHYPKGWLWVD